MTFAAWRMTLPLVLLLIVGGAVGCGLAERVGLAQRRPLPLSIQLEHLERMGIVVNEGVSEADIVSADGRAALEARPYDRLIRALAHEIEREPFTPKADRLWMCDPELIAAPGDYTEVLRRLERLTGGALGLTQITDDVNLDAGIAWVQFQHGGRVVRWHMRVEDDWLDPVVLARYQRLLIDARASVRLYADDEGASQSMMLAAFTPEQKALFDEMSRIRLELVPPER